MLKKEENLQNYLLPTTALKNLNMSDNFKKFISQLSETNATLDYFTDFEKIKDNVSKISIKLNQLNYLIGKKNLKLAIEQLYEENPKAFEVLNILIAVRKTRKPKPLIAMEKSYP